MSAVRETTLTSMKLQGWCPTHTRTHVRFGVREIIIDEPRSRGGTDRGPTPLQTLLASLIGCTNVILHKIAERDGVSLESLQLEAEAVLDRRGVLLQEEVAVPFPRIELRIRLATDAEDSRIDKLKSDLGRFCPVSKILRQSGTQIDETWTVTRQ